MPSQNLTQVTRSLRALSADWLNEAKLLTTEFAWEEEYFAYSVSPSGVQQVIDFIGKQEEYHQCTGNKRRHKRYIQSAHGHRLCA